MLEGSLLRRHASRFFRSRDMPDPNIFHDNLLVVTWIEGGSLVRCITFLSLANGFVNVRPTFEHDAGEGKVRKRQESSRSR